MIKPPSTRRWYHFRWWQYLLLFIALIAGGLGLYTWLGHRGLQAVLSDWDKLGRWRYADLIANQVAEEHNSVPSWVIRQARPLTWINLDDQRLHFQTREYEPNLLLHAESVQYLRNRANAWPRFLEQLKELDTIPDKPGVGPLITNKPWLVYYKYTEETHKVCSVLREQLWLALDEKNVPLVIELLRYEKRLAGHQLLEPYYINHLNGIGELARYVWNIQVTLAQTEPTDEELKQLSKDLGSFDSRAAWNKCLISEAGYTIDFLEYLARPDTDILKQFGVGPKEEIWQKIKQYADEVLLRSELRSPYFQAEMMRSLLKMYEEQEKPHSQLYRELVFRSDMQKQKQEEMLDARRLAGSPMHAMLYSILRLDVHWRCMLIALAAERFRLQHQRWPQSQNELIPKYLPAVLLDPFDDKPLRLKTVEDGLLIYSVVGNSLDRQFADDGGDIVKTDEKFTIKDTGVKLWDPAHRRKPAKPLERREEQE